MKLYCNHNAVGQGAKSQLNNTCFFFHAFRILFLCITFATLSCLSSFVQAQSIHWQSQGKFLIGYQLSTNATILPAEERFFVKLHLAVFSPMECLGAVFTLKHDTGIVPDNAPLRVPEDNWLGPHGSLAFKEIDNPDSNSVTYEIRRITESFVSGRGCVLTKGFQVGDTPVTSDHVLTSIGGNLIMDDNLDMKRMTSSTPSNAELPFRYLVYPNPSSTEVAFSPALPVGWSVQIRDLQGSICHQRQPLTGQRLDVRHLPPGLYLLEIFDVQGLLSQSLKFIKQK